VAEVRAQRASKPPTGGRRVRVIGFGCGPDQLTAEAVEALRSVDYVVAADKGAAPGGGDPLLAVRREICAAYDVELVAVPDPERDRSEHTAASYDGAVRDWHAARVAAYDAVLEGRPGDVGFLVWGDPAFYDSTLRIVDRLAQTRDLVVDVVPGISALQLLAARHRVVLHEVGRPLLVTTGRRLVADAQSHDNLAVFLDGRLTCRELADDWHIWWGANLGTPSERLVAGPLAGTGAGPGGSGSEEAGSEEAGSEEAGSEEAGVLGEIERAREEARAEAGWVMDTYLLRRPGTSGTV
jgi:precorrin-6A synthase